MEPTPETTLEKEPTGAEEVAEELMNIERETSNEHTVFCEITNVDKVSNQYRVTVEFPDGRTDVRRFVKPKVWSDSNEFVEFVQSLGYDSAAGVEQLPGTRCEVWVDDDDWEFSCLRSWYDEISWRMSGEEYAFVISSILTSYFIILLLMAENTEGAVQGIHLVNSGIVVLGFLLFGLIAVMGGIVGTLTYDMINDN